MNGTHRVKFTQNLDCNSINVIYLIQCSHCGNRYVGETGRSVRDRFNGHKRDKNHDISTNVTDHFLDLWGCNFDTKCQLIPLEQLPSSGCEDRDKENRLERENFWIKKLKTYEPWGLNTGYDHSKDGIIPFIVKYSKTATNLSRKIKSEYSNLQQLLPSVYPLKMTTAYQRNKNLQDYLFSSVI